MFKNHPRGLFVLFFTNMGERFGYYTMLAVFTLYLQAKYGYTTQEAGYFYSAFLFGVYFLPLLGGYIADNFLGYGRTIAIGLVIMFAGYALLAIPGSGLMIIGAAMIVISLGTGFFKGNLQALVGNLYDSKEYSANRDSAFIVFYMGINVGAFFAPFAATWATDFILNLDGLSYNQFIPAMAHEFLSGKMADSAQYLEMAKAQMGAGFTNLTDFSNLYIQSLSKSYNLGFSLAAISMTISFAIFLVFRKHYKMADVSEKQKRNNSVLKQEIVTLSKSEERQRYLALGLVFLVVIFFWMAFHQNGYTMTVFARDYTAGSVSGLHYIWFHLPSMLSVIGAIVGLILLVQKNILKVKVIGAAALILGAGLLAYFVSNFDALMPIKPQQFQSFNPLFILFLSPLIVAVFGWLQKRKLEPSAPKKIGIGMIVTALGFVVLAVASLGLPSVKSLDGGMSNMLVSPYWLISSYFTLTIAELFLSPIGISFVSKVAPPRHKGLMQGAWFAATAIGNAASGLVGYFWDKWELSSFFMMLVIFSLVSAAIMFSLLKVINRASGQ